MSTPFRFSGTGLESSIQSGSGGISSTDTSVEVDSIPSDLSAGDTVKVALGTATQWSDGNGETIYGDIGTIGGGANGGTNINNLSRGQEGTTASSWGEGDPVRIGVQGQEDVLNANAPVHWVPPAIAGDARIQFPFYGEARGTASPGRPRFTNVPLSEPTRITEVTWECTSAGSSPGDIDIRIYSSTSDIKPDKELIKVTDGTDGGATSTGEKTYSTDITLSAGMYFVGFHMNNWGTSPQFRGIEGDGPSWKQGSSHFNNKGVGWNTSFGDTLDSYTLNSRTESNILEPIIYLTMERP